ncbi:MAG: hypothetical protein FJ398_16965 [Verrucomicrobia bacterium]|nr:hypothetical protein [Verrucomicrobiota bacterium]
MKTTTIDSEHRATIPGSVPHERFWIIEEENGYRLQRLPKPDKTTKLSREDVIRALHSSKLTFPRDWEEMRADTREP